MFEGLTKFIPDLEDGKNTERTISKLEDAVYGFIHDHPECESRGVNLDKTPLSEVDAPSVGWLGVMGLLTAAVSEERRSCGKMKALYENGSLLRWLVELKKADEAR